MLAPTETISFLFGLKFNNLNNPDVDVDNMGRFLFEWVGPFGERGIRETPELTNTVSTLFPLSHVPFLSTFLSCPHYPTNPQTGPMVKRRPWEVGLLGFFFFLLDRGAKFGQTDPKGIKNQFSVPLVSPTTAMTNL